MQKNVHVFGFVIKIEIRHFPQPSSLAQVNIGSQMTQNHEKTKETGRTRVRTCALKFVDETGDTCFLRQSFTVQAKNTQNLDPMIQKYEKNKVVGINCKKMFFY